MTDLRSTIPALIAKRNEFGASTPVGRRLSTAIEQIENGILPTQTAAEIEQLLRDGGEYIHANHMKGEA